MGEERRNKEALGASEISIKINTGMEWAWGRQLAVKQPSSALVPEPHGEQLVAVLAIE